MVFFMIMPLLFGAFGNFLLPTQLGVHDVAFPRLNSAAFWFLPAGLIMLCQLVCLDRRYQRMNCFNVRELQILLRGRFFADLVNDTAHHNFLNNTMIGLRFKTNDLNSINPNTLLTYQYGLSNSPFTNNTKFTSQQQSLSTEGVYNFVTPTSFKYNTLTMLQGTNNTTLRTNQQEVFNLTESTPLAVLFSVYKLVKNTAIY